jgi:translation initiation factor 3 subunit M
LSDRSATQVKQDKSASTTTYYPPSTTSDGDHSFKEPEPTEKILEETTKRLNALIESGHLSMATPRPQLLFVDGTFAELAQAMADIVQVGEQVKPLIEKEQNEEALQTIVKASSHLNSVPEKDFNPSFNLLVHLVLESKDPKKYLPTMCSNLLKPFPNSPVNHISLAANGFTTIFNNLAADNPLRYNVLMQMCRFLKQNNHYDGLRPMLKNLPEWLKAWDTDEEDQRKLYVEVAEIASEGGDGE